MDGVDGLDGFHGMDGLCGLNGLDLQYEYLTTSRTAILADLPR